MRGTPVYVYDLATKCLVHMFDSKTYLQDNLGIDHGDLNKKYLDKDKPYYLRFVLSTTPLPKMSVEAIMTLEDTILLFKTTRAETPLTLLQGDRNKPVLAVNTINPELSKEFSSLQECARVLKGDRQTIRNHLNNTSTSLYRGQ